MLKFIDDKILCTFTSSTKHSLEEHKISCKKMVVLLAQYFKKKRIVKVYISLKGNKFACLSIGSGLFLVHDCVHDFWEKYPKWHVYSLCGARVHQNSKQGTHKNCVPEFLILSALKLPSCVPVVLIDLNTCILTEGRNFKTFLKENYAITLDTNSCCIFTKKCWTWNLMLTVLMEFAYIRHFWTLQQIH